MNTDLGLFILRVIAGLCLITHGWPKTRNFTRTMRWVQSEGFPLILISTTLLVLAEFVGAIFLILGIYTQYTAIIVALIFVVVIGYHLKKKERFNGEMEKAVLYLAAMICLVIAGGGAWTLVS